MRRNERGVLAVVAALVLSSSSAAVAAAPLVTPPLSNCCSQPSQTTDTFTCVVVNTGSGSTLPNVTIALVDYHGNTVVDVGPLALAPNDPRVLIWESSATGVYCRVTGSVSPRRTKMTLCNGESAGGPCKAVVTGP